MHELLTVVAEMRQRATEMKSMVAREQLDPTRLRRALYELEAAIHIMERAAANAYYVRAAQMSAAR